MSGVLTLLNGGQLSIPLLAQINQVSYQQKYLELLNVFVRKQYKPSAKLFMVSYLLKARKRICSMV